MGIVSSVGRQPLVHRVRRQQDRPDHAAGVITEFPTPTAGSRPWNHRRARREPLVRGVSGQQDRPDHAPGVITEFRPTPTAGPVDHPGPDGNLWFTEFDDDQVGQFNPTTHAIVEFPLPLLRESVP